MARQKLPDPPGEDVPGWIMTFSDVITLLMTFFILLLTFATNQPETFDRIQVALFGGGGSTGIAGEQDGMEKDALLMRERARSGRISPSGAEIPPMYKDPSLRSLDKGIAGLDESEERVLARSHHIELPLDSLISSVGQLTAVGQQRLRLIAIQMSKMPLHLEIAVQSESSLESGLILAEHLTATKAVPQAKVGVAITPHMVSDSENCLFMLTLREPENGS